MVVSVWFFVVREWFTVCAYTLDLGIESHPKDSDSVYKGPHMYSRPARIRTSNHMCKPNTRRYTKPQRVTGTMKLSLTKPTHYNHHMMAMQNSPCACCSVIQYCEGSSPCACCSVIQYCEGSSAMSISIFTSDSTAESSSSIVYNM